MSKANLIPRVGYYQNGGPVQKLQAFVDFINKLEGWKTKCKNLH